MATDIKFEYEEIEAVSPYYKNFFHRDDVQEYLMKNNLSEVYKICYDSLLNKSDVSLFTLTLYYLGIDVFDYIDYIPPYMFSYTSLSHVNIPNKIKSISDYAFQGTSLKEITIPGNVDIIGEYAFGDCDKLSYVKIEEGVRGIGDYVFYDTSREITIEVPDSVSYIYDSFPYYATIKCHKGSGADKYAQACDLKIIYM